MLELSRAWAVNKLRLASMLMWLVDDMALSLFLLCLHDRDLASTSTPAALFFVDVIKAVCHGPQVTEAT